MERRIFPKGKDAKGRSYEELRWSRFKHLSPVCLSGMQVVRGLVCDLRNDLATEGEIRYRGSSAQRDQHAPLIEYLNVP